MASKSVLDAYPQFAIMSLTTADVTTEVVSKLETGITTMQKVAWAVNRIEYMPGLAHLATGLAAVSHYVKFALSANGSASQVVDFTNGSIYDMLKCDCGNTGAGGRDPSRALPYIHQFGPGNELLIVPQNLYFVCKPNLNAGGTDTAYLRIWYKNIDMTSEDWYDLLQLRMPLGAVY